VGKKYIIEMEDKPFHKEDGDFLYRAKGFNSLVFDMTGIGKLTPYNAPDLERVRMEAYEEGFDVGRTLNDGKYEKGINDAWEAARKIGSNSMCSLKEIGFDFSQCVIPDYNPSWFVVKNYSASECIEKIRQYEQEKEEIQLWDEVINGRNFKGTVTDIKDDGVLTIFCQDRTWINSHTRFWKKTGRHFPEIAEVLEKMRGEQDGKSK